MLCQKCNARKATVHLSTVTWPSGEDRKHLCETCYAKAEGNISCRSKRSPRFMMGKVFQPLVVWLGFGSFAGLVLCRVADWGNEQFHQTGTGRVVTILLASVWGGTLFILVPLLTLLDRPQVLAMQERVSSGEVKPEALGLLRRQLFYAKYGSLPKYIYMPFVVTALVLGSILGLGLLLWLMLFVIVHVFGR